MKLYFENDLGIDGRYELPINFKPKWSPHRRRQNYQPRYSKDGSVQTGDGRFGSRTITFTFQTTSGGVGTTQQKDAAYREQIQDLISFFRPELSPFYLLDTDALLGVGLRARIDYLELTDDPLDGTTQRVSENRLMLEMVDGVWEDIEEQSAQDTGGISNGATFSIDNSGPLETYPYFLFSALNNVEEITLVNETIGQFFTYANTSYGAGSSLVIDGRGKEFVVTLDGVNTGSALADGSGPIQLDPGLNDFTFESPVGQVQYEILWRRRYPV